MTQHELNEAVAAATGEHVSLIHDRGFEIADPFEVNFDPEARRPLMLDWDSMTQAPWPEW